MILRPDQSVNDLVYVNSDNSPNLELYESPGLATDSAQQSNDPAPKTKT